MTLYIWLRFFLVADLLITSKVFWAGCFGFFLSYNLSLMLVFCQGSFNRTGLVVSSKLPRFSDLYTLTIASSDPNSISANKPVEFTKSITKWSVSNFAFTCTCYVIMEGLKNYDLANFDFQVHKGWSSRGRFILERRWQANWWLFWGVAKEQVIEFEHFRVTNF